MELIVSPDGTAGNSPAVPANEVLTQERDKFPAGGEMVGFASPNHTQTPNDLFDEYLPLMGEAELKVVLYTIRQTHGFHRERKPISLTEYQKATGLSRRGVQNGVAQAVSRGLIREAGTAKRNKKVYELVTYDTTHAQNAQVEDDESSDYSTQCHSTIARSAIVPPSTIARSAIVQARLNKEVLSTKESTKETPAPRLRDEWYDAIQETFHATAAENGLYRKMLLGKATEKGWKEYNLETPLTSPGQLREWAKDYKRKNPRAGIVKQPVKVQSSIGHWQSSGVEPKPHGYSEEGRAQALAGAAEIKRLAAERGVSEEEIIFPTMPEREAKS